MKFDRKFERKMQAVLGVAFGAAAIVGYYLTLFLHYDSSINPAIIAFTAASVALLLGLPHPRMSLVETAPNP